MLTLQKYHANMYLQLHQQVEKIKPGLMIIDRFTLAGFDVARALQIPYIVNNPHLLLDIDNPSYNMPAAYSLLSSYPVTLWERGVNLYHRFGSL